MPVPNPVTRVPFGGLLQRRIPINFIEGEEVIEVVYRHWFVLLVRELPALAVLVAGVVAGEVFLHLAPHSPNGQLFLLGGIVIGLGYALLIYLNYADDVFVLTTHRVIDIDRLLYILADYSNDAPYARIQDVHVERNFMGKLLGFGSIKVETSGRKYPVQMTDVPHAFAIMDRIFAQINSIRERESVLAVNRQKKENHRWMATVLNELVVEVPDVRGLPLLQAGARVRQSGLKLVVDRERVIRGTPPGRIIDQAPSPGSTQVSDNEVRVVLSGRPTP
jgi:membrane protein YdbS with pleckstrin-like domain